MHLQSATVAVSSSANHSVHASSGRAHELHFASLFHAGRGIVIPCSATGTVDLDSLSEKLRNAYLGARALIGREYAFPIVQLLH